MSKFRLLRFLSKYFSLSTLRKILGFLPYYVKGLFHRMNEHHIFLSGGGIAFSLLLSIFPIILLVLDHVSISGKWKNKDISLVTLRKKRILLKEMLKWFRDIKWDIWLSIYCNYFTRNKNHIKRNFERIRKKSVTEVNRRIRIMELKELK